MAHLIIKITSNGLVTLVAAKENCFHEPFKTIQTVRKLLSSSWSWCVTCYLFIRQ